jgi:hypothetical protein
MEFIKKFKCELITFFVFSGLSILYYLDTGEVKIMGALVLSFFLLSIFIRCCEKLVAKYRAKPISKHT